MAMARSRRPERDFLQLAAAHQTRLEKNSEKFSKQVGLRLRQRREELELSIKQLMLASGVSDETIRQTEAGRNSPTLKTAYRLARALGVNMQELFDDAGIPERNGDQKPIQSPLVNVAASVR